MSGAALAAAEASDASGGSATAVRRTLAASVAVYVVVRAATLVAVVVAAQGSPVPVLDLLTKADGLRYLAIAADGYGSPPPIGPDGAYTETTNLAFFPLYPATIRLLSWAMDPRVAAVLAALVAGLVAAILMTLWAVPRVGRTGAVVVVALWSLWPSAVVYGMGYSESLFVATVAGCLLALQRERWTWAAVACALAGLTRPTGAAVLAAVLVALVVHRPPVRIWLPAAAIAPVGLLVSLGHVALATGRWDGWFWIERTVWRSGFDGGRSTLANAVGAVTGTRDQTLPPYVVAAVTCVVAVVLLVALLVERPPVDEAVYAVLATVMALGGVGYFHCKPRFLGVVLPILVPPARWLSRLPGWLLVALGIVALALSVRWSAWFVVTWRFSV